VPDVVQPDGPQAGAADKDVEPLGVHVRVEGFTDLVDLDGVPRLNLKAEQRRFLDASATEHLERTGQEVVERQGPPAAAGPGFADHDAYACHRDAVCRVCRRGRSPRLMSCQRTPRASPRRRPTSVSSQAIRSLSPAMERSNALVSARSRWSAAGGVGAAVYELPQGNARVPRAWPWGKRPGPSTGAIGNTEDDCEVSTDCPVMGSR